MDHTYTLCSGDGTRARALARTLCNSSSLATASRMCRGVMSFFLLSRAALPASSRTWGGGRLLDAWWRYDLRARAACVFGTHLSTKVLQHGGEVDGRSHGDTTLQEATLEIAVYPRHGQGEGGAYTERCEQHGV